MSGLSVYLIAYTLLLAYGMVVLRVFVRREYQKRGNLSVTTSVLQALLFFMYGGFPYLYVSNDWPDIHISLLGRVVGLTAVGVGLAVLLYGVIKLGVLRSTGRDANLLVRSGLYRSSRNPQAIACAIYVVGFAMLWPSWYAVWWAILYFVLIHAMILTEEEHLLRIHGEEYRDYCRKVPRYLRLRGRVGKPPCRNA